MVAKCAFLVVMNLLINSCEIAYIKMIDNEEGCYISFAGDQHYWTKIEDVGECNLLQMQLLHLSGNGL